ncbi:hypothetical protein O9X98_07905 [Agrobacterium salinitolerans]|nr:hypothetical protein [Agrobacterium salinitolerans]
MSDRDSLGSRVQVIHVNDIDDELLDQIMNAKWGEVSDDGPHEPAVKGEKDERIERLEELLYDIALMAESHKVSRLYLEGENVALVTIRNMAAGAIGMGGLLREKGTLLAAGTAVADRD